MSEFGSQAPPTGQQAPTGPGGPIEFEGRGSGPRAGFWRRFGAYLIDYLILAVPYVVFALLLDAGIAYALYLVADFGYFTYFEGGRTGQTVGKRALGIRVIDFRAGGAIGYGRGFLRQLGKLLSGLILVIGYLWMLWDKEKQTWHDKIATTVVVPASSYPVL